MEDKQLHLQQYFSPVSADEWEAEVERVLKGRKAATLEKNLYEGLTQKPLYHQADSTLSPDTAFANAGFSRSIKAFERRQAGWDIRQVYDSGALEQVAEAIATDIHRGANSLWLVPGWAATHPSSLGAGGLDMQRLDELRSLLKDVNLAETPVSLASGNALLPSLVWLTEVANDKGVSPSSLMGSVYVDPIGVLASHGELPHGLESAWSELALGLKWRKQHQVDLDLWSASGLVFHDAGASAAQELAFVLANAVETLRQMEQRGADLNEVAAAGFAQVGVGRHMFVEMAKVRALRMLWAKVMKACGVDAGHHPVFVHAVTSRVTTAQRDPWVNFLRNTAECFSAVTGGADAVTITPFERALGVPGELGLRMAVKTQLVLEKESHLSRVVDPAAGSWYVESLTDSLAREAWSLFQTIEGQGGIVSCLREGSVHEWIAEVVAQKSKNGAKRKAAVLGVSEYANLEEEALKRPSWPEGSSEDPGFSGELVHHLAEESNVAATMEALTQASQQGVSVAALEAALHPEGSADSVEPLPVYRWAAAWEALRDAVDAFAEEHGKAPSVFLANLGSIPEHKARAGFAQRFFAAGGVTSVSNDGFSDMNALAQAYAESGASGLVICGKDEAYVEQVESLMAAVTTHRPTFVALAGRPGEHENIWTNAGVTHYLYLGCDALSVLQSLHRALGVTA